MKRFQRSHCDRKLSKQQVFNKSAITIRCRRIVVTVTHFSQSPSPSNPHQMNFRCRMRNCSAWDSSGPDSKVEGSTNSAQKKNKKLARFISGSWNISFRRFFIFISIFDFEKKNDLEFVQGNVTESVYLAGFWELISFY